MTAGGMVLPAAEMASKIETHSRFSAVFTTIFALSTSPSTREALERPTEMPCSSKFHKFGALIYTPLTPSPGAQNGLQLLHI